jgi:choline dehydrogenase
MYRLGGPGLTSRIAGITLFALGLLSSTAFAVDEDNITGQKLLGSSFGTPVTNATYDYLIVGGGTAGLALANRLTESGKHTVAVIEAGSFYEISNSNLSMIPRWVWNGAGLDFSDANPLVDWMIETEPEDGLQGQRIHYPRGRCLGGSSARNHMVYHRATKGSYKKWADDVGDASYEWENFSKYFDKSTTFYEADMSKRNLANSTPAEDPAGKRATDGPVSIAYANFALSFSTWVIKALNALGLPNIPGFIDGDLIGVSWNLRTVDPKTQVRVSAETAYLRPALQRTNLIVYHTTTALKVLFNGTEAVGVQCSTLGKKFTLSARNELIVSAGAFQSPQLLMVSGIGPKETLQRYSIPVLKDAPGVGQGMEVRHRSRVSRGGEYRADFEKDHPGFSVTYKVRLESSTVLDSPAKNEQAVKDYLKDGTGPLGSTGGELVGR